MFFITSILSQIHFFVNISSHFFKLKKIKKFNSCEAESSEDCNTLHINIDQCRSFSITLFTKQNNHPTIDNSTIKRLFYIWQRARDSNPRGFRLTRVPGGLLSRSVNPLRPSFDLPNYTVFYYIFKLKIQIFR